MKRKALLAWLVFWLAILVMPAHADDTEIYGGVSATIEPNILILFDSSGSMLYRDVPRNEEYVPYDSTYPSRNYSNRIIKSGSERDAVQYADTIYAREDETKEWEIYQEVYYYGTPPYLTANSPLRTFFWDASKRKIKDPGEIVEYKHTFNGRKYTQFALGNYIMWMDRRLDVAREVITDLVENTEGVRLGLMRFTYPDTTESSYNNGKLVTPIKDMNGSARKSLVADINNLQGRSWTPLASSLAEAGWYYAGRRSWDSASYTSPVKDGYDCQPNYIILMTDGTPSRDGTYRGNAQSGGYMTGRYIHGVAIPKYKYEAGETIPDFEYDDNGRRMTAPTLADVAEYLYRSGTGENVGERTVITYTIGFQTNQSLLEETARRGSDLGKEGYFTVTTKDALADAFKKIIGNILQVDSIFVSPVVPVSQQNRSFAGSYLYVGFFRPNERDSWDGNIKKYYVDANTGNILDVNGNPATDANGAIKSSAQSFWSEGVDGSSVTKGGVGGLLSKNTNRVLYTHIGDSPVLSHPDNAFSSGNDVLTKELLQVEDASERIQTIRTVVNGAAGTTGESTVWKMGDVLHSAPAVVTYGRGTTAKSYIFAGTNRGVLHAFDDATGKEIWGFVPKEQLGRVKKLWTSPAEHAYFIDGTPVVYQNGSKTLLFVGERRGGSNYYALDISSPTEPVYRYTITDTVLSGDQGRNEGATLGQSWSTPTPHTIKTGSNTSETVFLMGGGYDRIQDAQLGKTPAGTEDSVGKAVFTIAVDSGQVSSLNFNGANFPDMRHSIID
ncbi:hypothetical protein LJC47_01130, partial [Desulfosarcina sp. OttesenSCG-928-B08]|nr:hypothetical protein [Desulfosarcina sp. OttesenSCG-928-B08]